jgi:hypothetical protein
MSKNHENVTWQSKDGTWSVGFFTVIQPSYMDDDYDDEWDVDYDYDSFVFASTGHRTPEQADRSWPGPNPGLVTHIPYKGHAQDAKHYDLLASYYKNPALKVADDKKKVRAAARARKANLVK